MLIYIPTFASWSPFASSHYFFRQPDMTAERLHHRLPKLDRSTPPVEAGPNRCPDAGAKREQQELVS